MNGKKILFVAAAALLLVVGWMLALQAATGEREKKAQNELVEQAREYAEKELYVRAIEAYEDALAYSTDSNTEIETELLTCYTGHGDTTDYVDLVESRISKKTATTEEILTAAGYCLESSSKVDDALVLLQEGMALLGDPEIEEMYETYRYGYKLRSTNYTEITPTSENTLMPAFDGESWGYVDSNGRVQISMVYEMATPFNTSGYAVVRENGTYYVILQDGDRYGVDETGITDVIGLTSSYVIAKAGETYSFFNYDFVNVLSSYQYDHMTILSDGIFAALSGESWSILSSSGETILGSLEDVAVNSLGQVYTNSVAMVKMGGLWYLVDTEGKKISDTGYADAKAPESDGYIAVADESGKWGYIDQKGNQVIDFQYADALSFSDDLGAVKVIDTWGYISEKNELVIDEYLTSAQPFHNGIAQAGFVDGTALIELRYYEVWTD